MGWFSKLVTPSSTLKRQEERERRRALNEAKRLADSTSSQIEKLGQERDNAWEEAKAYLARGQKAAAQRLIQTVRAKDAQIQKMEKKTWVFKEYLGTLEMAETDKMLAESLNVLNHAMNIDPDKIAATVDRTEDLIADQTDVESVWTEKYNDSMGTLALNDAIPSVEQMMGDLEAEVSGDIAPMSQIKVADDAGVQTEIDSRRSQLSAMLADKQ
ncbi:MAG: hypothetical protein E7058_04670 [Lentisphaerae bacterium]|nr:hypothetical protein [Lentisphaerota bacterium]